MLKHLTWVHPHLIGKHPGAKSDKSKTCPTGSQPSHKVLIFQFHHICRADWFIRSPLPTLLMVDYHHDVVTNFTSLCAKDKNTTNPVIIFRSYRRKREKIPHDARADVKIKRSGAERLAGAGGTASRWDLKENDDKLWRPLTPSLRLIWQKFDWSLGKWKSIS